MKTGYSGLFPLYFNFCLEKWLTIKIFVRIIVKVRTLTKMEGVENMQDTEDKFGEICTGRLIHVLSHQMKRRNAALRMKEDDGLTTMQKHVLNFILLETLHKDVYQKDIEEEFQVRKSTVTGMLQLMEKNGFIYRENAEKDARLKRIIPTPKSEALRPMILEHIRNVEERLIQGVSSEDIAVFRKVILRMLQNLADTEKENKEAGERHE